MTASIIDWKKAYLIEDAAFTAGLPGWNTQNLVRDTKVQLIVILGDGTNSNIRKISLKHTLSIAFISSANHPQFDIGISNCSFDTLYQRIISQYEYYSLISIPDKEFISFCTRVNKPIVPLTEPTIELVIGDLEDERRLTIGRTRRSCLVYIGLLLKSKKNAPFFTAAPNNPSPALISVNISYYINCALAFLDDNDYKDVVRRCQELVAQGKVSLYLAGQNEVAQITDLELPMSNLLIQGFLGLGAFSKWNSDPEFIKDWSVKRIPALFSKLGAPIPSLIYDYSHDVKYVGKFLDDYLPVRQQILRPFLYTQCNSPSDQLSVLRSQLQMVLADVGMTTFNLCLVFAELCETGVHELRVVCDQSLYIIATHSALLQEMNGKPYRPSYYYAFNPRDPKFDMAHYPDLAFCAIQYQKLSGVSSWQNYLGDRDLPLTVSKSFLLEKLKVKLQIIGGPVGDPVVRDYLQDRGRASEPGPNSQANVITDLANVLRNLATSSIAP